MDNIIHTNYVIRNESGKIIIDYKLTPREWFQFLYNFLLGAILVYFPAYGLYSNKYFEWKTTTVIGVCFFSLIIFWGFLKQHVACELICKPTKSFLIIDNYEKTIKVKLIFFRTALYTFDSIKAIQLSGHDTIIEDNVRGQKYKRRLYVHQLNFLLKDGRVKKIHKFISGKVFIPSMSKTETYEVSTISKKIARLIALETGIKYAWLGTKKTDADA